jgi:AraC family transcriptional regulator
MEKLAAFEAIEDAGGASIVALGFGSRLPLTGNEARDAIQVLVPGAGAAISAVYRTEEGHERRAFVRAPMVAVIPPGRSWRMQCQEPCDTLVLQIAPGFYAQQVRAALGEAPQLVARYAAFDPFIREVASALLAELQSDRPPNAAYLEPLAGVMAVHLARHYGAAAPDAAAAPCGLPAHRLRRVQSFITEHLAEVIHVDRLAAEAHMSQFHFARMFKQATGQPPHLYVVMQRVGYAKALLRGSDLPLIDVAGCTGFRTQGHFTGVFRRYTGFTPRAFRLACRAAQDNGLHLVTDGGKRTGAWPGPGPAS